MAKHDRPGRPTKPSLVHPEQRARSAAARSTPTSLETLPPRGARHRVTDPSSVARRAKIREDFQLAFGENFRAARLKSGLRQSDIAAITGLTQQYLSLIEAGQQNITLKTMILLADVVDHNMVDMLRRAVGKTTKT